MPFLRNGIMKKTPKNNFSQKQPFVAAIKKHGGFVLWDILGKLLSMNEQTVADAPIVQIRKCWLDIMT